VRPVHGEVMESNEGCLIPSYLSDDGPAVDAPPFTRGYGPREGSEERRSGALISRLVGRRLAVQQDLEERQETDEECHQYSEEHTPHGERGPI
jgi:hypothetical protein